MDNTTVQIIWTVLVFITFMGIIFWAYSSARKKDFDAAANSIFDDAPSIEAAIKTSTDHSHENTKETL